jgi:hypothetical protein
MTLSFEQALIEVWRQALVENAKTVELGTERVPVRPIPKRGLRQVDFVFEGNEIRGLEQNRETKSRWAQLARTGKKVMQFLRRGPLRGECGGWEGQTLQWASRDESVRRPYDAR